MKILQCISLLILAAFVVKAQDTPAAIPGIDCATRLCPLIRCLPGFRLTRKDGECCPSCVPDCSIVLCLKPECEEGQQLVTPEGECCPKCIPDCSAVSCLKPVCGDGQQLITPEGECCPKCVPDCSAVLCLNPVCEEGQNLIVPEGECCAKCVPDCSAVLCLNPVCEEGQNLIVPEGECCAKCVPDCSAVICLRPVCEEGEELFTPEGECCSQCRRIVPECPIKGQRFSDCASCPATCDNPDLICLAVCRPGCSCPPGQVIDNVNRRCVPLNQCPRNECPVKGQVFSFCAGCDSTCNQILNGEPRICPAVCRPGCSCPGGQSIDTANNVCVDTDECPNPCATVDCLPNSRCKVDLETGEPFCKPSCDIANGGCRDDQICKLKEVQCKKAPCLPVVECRNRSDVCTLPPETGPCEALIKRFFHNATSGQCETFTYGGCEGNDNNFLSKADCQRKCGVNPCATVLCAPGSVCKVFEPTGEAFCEPSCDIDNGGCRDDQTCELEQVFCIRAPCPPVVRCKDPKPDPCSLPPETGPCRAFFRRFFHNATSGRCEQFIYGGCLGNENNFRTREECERRCGVINACALVLCPQGSLCKIYEPTGEPFCEPSCDIQNGGCPRNQVCKLRDVDCVRSPCPAEVECLDRNAVCTLKPETGPCRAAITQVFYNSTSGQCEKFIYGGCGGNDNRFNTQEACERACGPNPCDTHRCPVGSRCEIYEPTGEAFCNPDCNLNNGGCRDNQRCELNPVLCVRAPCPPEVRCVDIDPCATVRCANGFRCEVFKPTGRPFCNPDCDLNNGGCPADQECQLLPTPCPGPDFPCPPARVCRPRLNDTCPPTCTPEFCSQRQNRRALCSDPGPREIPGCTGNCQVTFCHICYYAENAISPAPGNCNECENLRDYTSDTRCYRRWANCVRRAHWWQYGRPARDVITDDNFRCYRPPCPLKG